MWTQRRRASLLLRSLRRAESRPQHHSAGSRCPSAPGSTGGSTGTSTGTGWVLPQGYDTGVRVYNSLTRRKDPLVLSRERVATWYSCGPTVYDHAHLGHACSYVRFDLLQRLLLRVFGVSVVHVMVVTDIDDKIIRRSWEEKVSPFVISRRYEDEFKRDMLDLKVVPPLYIRVTDCVPQIISFIQGIIANGHAYATPTGDVYFDVSSIGDRYGKFGSAGETQRETDWSQKRDGRDFSLWKPCKPDEPWWASPWGRGRPGWHIECSTIASGVFGGQLDVHSGGVDLAFPHHENEVAQSEAFHQNTQWANYFLHSGHLHLKGSSEKMSKSLKNYITIKDFLQSHSADEFRMFCLQHRYSAAVDYSTSSLEEARSSLQTFSSFLQRATAYMRGQLVCEEVQEELLWRRLSETRSIVLSSFSDDFDTASAVSAMLALVREGNRQLAPLATGVGGPRSPAVFGAIVSYINDMMETFGIDLKNTEVQQGRASDGGGARLEGVVEQLSAFRSAVRSFSLERREDGRRHDDRTPLLRACDELREGLGGLGVNIQDHGASSTWEIKAPPPRSQENKDTPT